MKRIDLFIAGFGGQGVLLAGQVFAYAGILEGLNVSYFPAYGVEKRGGTANCTVIVAAGEVGSPVVGSPGVSLLLDQNSIDQFLPKVRSGGLCLVNASLLQQLPTVPPGVRVVPIALNRLAQEAGDVRLVNMVVLGALLELSRCLQIESLHQALQKMLPERNHRFLPLNYRAMELGAEAVRAVA